MHCSAALPHQAGPLDQVGHQVEGFAKGGLRRHVCGWQVRSGSACCAEVPAGPEGQMRLPPAVEQHRLGHLGPGMVSYQLQQKAEEIIDNSKRMVVVLSGDRQALWAMLRLCTLSMSETVHGLHGPQR